MKVVVVGAGYVGMSQALLLDRFHEVVIVDTMKSKVDSINNRISPIIDSEVERHLRCSRLIATTNANGAYSIADYVIIAVPTNYDDKTNTFDTSIVYDVVKSVYNVNRNAKVVIKSTIPIGFTDYLVSEMIDMSIMFSPEFLREGRALLDNLYPSRIIVGHRTSDKKYAEEFAEMLSQASKLEDPSIILTGTREAESIKLFANTYLAMRVGFFNELDSFAMDRGLDTKSIIQGVCADSRIGEFYNNPSFGYGGYCLPKDTKQMLANYGETPQELITAIVKCNDTRKKYIAKLVNERAISLSSKNDVTVGVYKLAMKEGSDNFRESAILDIASILRDMGVNVIIYEPSIIGTTHYEGFCVVNSLDKFISSSDVIIANRVDARLLDNVSGEKIISRDVFSRD